MLPDYPLLKKEIFEVIEIYLRERMKTYATVLQEIPKFSIFEGKGMVIKRKTGEEDPTEFDIFKAGLELKLEEIPKMTIDDILSKIDGVARKMADNMESKFFKSIGEQLGKAKRAEDKKAEPLSAESVLKALKAISIPFDSQGNPVLPTFFLHPDLEESIKKAVKNLHENSKLKKEYDILIQQKKEGWRAEEASRKLVG